MSVQFSTVVHHFPGRKLRPGSCQMRLIRLGWPNLFLRSPEGDLPKSTPNFHLHFSTWFIVIDARGMSSIDHPLSVSLWRCCIIKPTCSCPNLCATHCGLSFLFIVQSWVCYVVLCIQVYSMYVPTFIGSLIVHCFLSGRLRWRNGCRASNQETQAFPGTVHMPRFIRSGQFMQVTHILE